jgi:hypothetical protein
MTVTFAPAALIPEELIAMRSLTQLNLMSLFPRSSMGDYEKGSFEVGDTVKFRRPKISEAQEYDPRTGSGLNLTQPGYLSGNLTLEKLLANGFPLFSSDFKISTYVRDFSDQIAQSIATKFDGHLYNKFRTATHSSTGEVAFSSNAPIACVANENGSGELSSFDRSALIHAGTVLDRENVPAGNRFAEISSTAKGDFLGEATPVDAGYLEAIASGSTLLQQGLPIGQFLPRYGFMVGGSNTIGSQVGSTDLDGAASNQPAVDIASAVSDTANGGQSFFVAGDFANRTSLGAIVLTLGTTGALQNVAVGDIARIGPTAGNAKAYGIVLRVNLATKTVYIVPFSMKGQQLVAAQINPAVDKFSIPMIPSISIAHHREALVYSTRMMEPPSEGSGATAVTQVQEGTNVALQVWSGSFDVTRFRESRVASLLMGAKITDYRKACLMLSL